MNTPGARAHVTHAALALAAVLALALALTGCQTKVITAPQATGAGASDTVTAVGSGTALSKPDKAEMTFGIRKQAPTAKAAMAGAAAVAKKINAALVRAGVAKKDLQTTAVTLQPQYAYSSKGTPRVTGYEAQVTVRATTEKLDTVGDIIVAATSAGANDITGPTFSMSDTNPSRYDAINAAVTDARARAEAMAKAAGREVSDVVTMTESAAQASPVSFDSARALSANTYADSMKVEPGQLETQASVTVVFKLR